MKKLREGKSELQCYGSGRKRIFDLPHSFNRRNMDESGAESYRQVAMYCPVYIEKRETDTLPVQRTVKFIVQSIMFTY